VQTSGVQLQTPPDQTWLAKSERRATSQDPEKEGHTEKQHTAENSIHVTKIL